jgi:tetratricopeptide (TPR) repeat protein
MLLEDKKPLEAFEVVIKVRPGYARVTDARLLEGYLATQLVNAKAEGPPLPDAKKTEIFKRAVADLVKVPKPAHVAKKEEVISYLSARCRLATLLFAQGKADPVTEKANPGYNQALAISEEVIGLVPTYDELVKLDGGMKKLNVDGMGMLMLAQDTHSRAVYLRARALIDAGKFGEADKALEPILTVVKTSGPVFTAEMKAWAEGGGGDAEAVQKSKVAQLAAAVDKTRVEVVLAGFRLKVKDSKPNEAAELLDLMIKAGGSIEDNLPVLELLGREMAAQMAQLRKEGKKADADALGAGLAVLLKKITAVPKLSPQMMLFIGQTLQTVGEYDKAIETLKKIPVPEFAGWEQKKPEEIPQEVRGRVTGQIRDFSVAQLTIARALREGGKLDEAEKMLLAIIGTAEKQGWGYGRLYFRRELALVYEGKGKAASDPKVANTEWGKALKEWTTLFNIHKNRLQNPPKDASPEQMKQYRNAFAEAYFDVQRCLVRANIQLLGTSNAAKLQKTFDDVGKRFADMEKQIPVADWQPEVQHQYVDFLKEVPQLAASYRAASGKLFLDKLPLP